jgi:hypothetical protein
LKAKTLAYLAHPLGPDGPQREANRAAASKILADLQLKYQDRVFVASWITLSGQWSETPKNRKLGLGCDLALLEHCQEIWLAGPEISKGMQIELDFAKAQGLRVIDETYTLDRETVIQVEPTYTGTTRFMVGDQVFHRRADLYGRVVAPLPDSGSAYFVKYEWPYDPNANPTLVPVEDLRLRGL